MGIDLYISFSGPAPAWETIQALLRGYSYPVQTRMIDGQLAFPDEQPPETWNELRVAGPGGGMVTVRRVPEGITCVIWGNADLPTRQCWNALAWAFAEARHGIIQVDQQRLSSSQFRRSAEMPESIKAPDVPNTPALGPMRFAAEREAADVRVPQFREARPGEEPLDAILLEPAPAEPKGRGWPILAWFLIACMVGFVLFSPHIVSLLRSLNLLPKPQDQVAFQPSIDMDEIQGRLLSRFVVGTRG